MISRIRSATLLDLPHSHETQLEREYAMFKKRLHQIFRAPYAQDFVPREVRIELSRLAAFFCGKHILVGTADKEVDLVKRIKAYIIVILAAIFQCPGSFQPRLGQVFLGNSPVITSKHIRSLQAYTLASRRCIRKIQVIKNDICI